MNTKSCILHGKAGAAGAMVAADPVSEPDLQADARTPNFASPSAPGMSWCPDSHRRGPREMLLHACAIFVSAFLVFQVQPIIAKAILPWFGGTPAVWTTCMLFFQIVLLMGYAYAHGAIRLLAPRAQGVVHTVLLALAAFLLPIAPAAAWKPAGDEDPSWRILGLLAATVGLPYFVLAATAPLLQAWFARSFPGRSPYRLYALSNLGSMLALLTYPVLVEPELTTAGQERTWSAGFLLFALLGGACAVIAARSPAATATADRPGLQAAPGLVRRALWLALSACGSTLLLAVTNQVCQEVAVVPFLWILPLSLYLLSFILCFESDRWYRRTWALPALALALGAVAYALSQPNRFPLEYAVPIYAGGLFVCCMFCHGELAALRPAAADLTAFYLMSSIGGAAGGVFVGLLAPRWFCGFYELHVGILACALLATLLVYGDLTRGTPPGRRRRLLLALHHGVLVVIAIVCGERILVATERSPRIARNFYGVLRVETMPTPDRYGLLLTLMHGGTCHGTQFLDAKRRAQPTTYYGRGTGLGILMEVMPRQSPRRVGLVGLGAGTSAAYGQPGDLFRFYEINPHVIELAQREFTYLGDCRATVEIRLGDARLSLENEPDQHYDILALDAFSSDAIPVHLLTREAFRLYFRHLNADGVLAVHVSNLHLKLAPIVASLAAEAGKSCWRIENPRDDDEGVSHAEWVLVTASADLLARLAARGRGQELLAADPPVRPWTDDYSNLFQVLK